MEDISSYSNNNNLNLIQPEIDELANEVLVNNEKYEKFRKLYLDKLQSASIDPKKFDNNFNQFVNSFQQFSQAKKFSKSATTMLFELAQEASISQSKVDNIITHYETKWSSEREKQEADKRKKDEELLQQQEIENKKHEEERKKEERIEWWRNNKKTIHIVGISMLCIISAILFFSKVYLWATVSFGLSYGLLVIKAHQEEWIIPLLKWTGIILGGLAGAAILFGLGYLIYEYWETILSIIGIIVILGILDAIITKVLK